MDGINPVGAMVQPPNPTQGLNAYSTLLGIQQQKLGIQQQQQALQGQAAQVSQEQQKNKELKDLQQFAMQATNDPAYHNSDGSLNVQKFQTDAMARAPTYGAEYVGQITRNANEGVENRRTLLSLSNEQRQTIGQYMGAVAANPNATKQDFQDAITRVRGVSDDPKFQSAIDSMMMSAPPMRNMTDQEESQAVRQFARAGAMAVGAPNAAQSAPQMESYQAPGNVLGLRQTNPQSPMGVGAVKGGVVAGVAPSQQPSYLAQATTAQGAASGQVGTDTDVYRKVMAAGADSARGVELAQKVEQDAAGVRTGKYTKDFADRLTILQQHDPGATARQLLQKDAENLKSLAESTATSDKEREQIGSGYPSPETMGPDAIQKAARYWQGSFRQAGARRDNVQSHVANTGSVAGLTQKDAEFMKSATPGRYAPPEPPKKMPTGAKLTTYANTHFNGDTAKASAFLKQQGYE